MARALGAAVHRHRQAHRPRTRPDPRAVRTIRRSALPRDRAGSRRRMPSRRAASSRSAAERSWMPRRARIWRSTASSSSPSRRTSWPDASTAATGRCWPMADPVARWQRIFAERRGLYEEVADITFDTSTGPLAARRRRDRHVGAHRTGRRGARMTGTTTITVSGDAGYDITSAAASWIASARPLGPPSRKVLIVHPPTLGARSRAAARTADVARHARGPAGRDPGRRAGQARRGRCVLLAGHGSGRLHPHGCGGRLRRGSGDRPGRIRRSHLAARRAGRAGADDRARHGRRRRRRQDRHQHRGGQEPRRRVLGPPRGRRATSTCSPRCHRTRPSPASRRSSRRASSGTRRSST